MIVGTRVQVINVDPGLVTYSGQSIPGAARIAPLDGIAAGSVTGSPRPGAGVLGDVIGIAPFRRVTWRFLQEGHQCDFRIVYALQGEKAELSFGRGS